MSNQSSRHAWAERSPGWVRDAAMLDAVFAPFTEAVLSAACLGSARRVLDVGCGIGTLLRHLVERDIEAVGVDISAAMIEAAGRLASGATVIEADAQVVDLLGAAGGEPFDRVISRFGVMFFDDPVAAFVNLRAAAAPGAVLAFTSWRAEEVDMFEHGLRGAVARLRPAPPPPPVDRPGPRGLGTHDHIRRVLSAAGWSRIRIEPFDGRCDFCVEGSDGVEERLAMLLNGSVGQAVRGRLEEALGPDGWQRVLGRARDELRSRMVDGGVRLVGRTWLVGATNQGASGG